MKKLIIYTVLALPLFASAQNFNDALRYSRLEYLGTARFNALGGSMGAVGGDLSALSVNPAALGVYRNSEFTLSTDFMVDTRNTAYRNSKRDENFVKFNLGNIGYVGAYKGDPNGWKNYSFAVGYNRLNNFNNQERLYGNDASSSIVDDYVLTLNEVNATTSDVWNYAYPYGPSEAYETYLIDSINPNVHARSVYFQDNVEQSRRIARSGRQGETFFSFGGNYLDRLALGATIAFQSIHFESNKIFTEKYTYDPPAQSDEFLANDYSEESNLITSGTGVNFKIGAIYRVTNSLRVGGSIHSPTFFGMTESYTYQAKSKFSDGQSFESLKTEATYQYRLRTPTRYNASLAYVFGEKGLINVDYELVNYAAARLNDANQYEFDFAEINNEITSTLTNSQNLRVGAEYRIEPFVLRAGYRYESNPFQSNVNLKPDETRNTFSIGTGFRSKNYNVDLTYMQSNMSYIDPVYNTSEAAAKTNQAAHHLMFTVGWKW
ncbi:MAG: hypothetical protein DWP98_12605 [Bacteroidetes bacterium]|nr:MAG: hypothetical protein DWP98_12605 [Bacteroidota bacterium]MBL1145162.1 hypothetical protein [Bacteroidota bacterium]NOG57958.1 hypothetical protein [Bacteroidota bacterium]